MLDGWLRAENSGAVLLMAVVLFTVRINGFSNYFLLSLFEKWAVFKSFSFPHGELSSGLIAPAATISKNTCDFFQENSVNTYMALGFLLVDAPTAGSRQAAGLAIVILFIQVCEEFRHATQGRQLDVYVGKLADFGENPRDRSSQSFIAFGKVEDA